MPNQSEIGLRNWLKGLAAGDWFQLDWIKLTIYCCTVDMYKLGKHKQIYAIMLCNVMWWDNPR